MTIVPVGWHRLVLPRRHVIFNVRPQAKSMIHDEDEIDALAKRMGVTREELLSSDFWRDVGGHELDTVERTIREESESSGGDSA
jgi:hypothetical protein